MAISEETKITIAPAVNEAPKEQQPAKEQKEPAVAATDDKTEESPETKAEEATLATEEKKEKSEEKTVTKAPKIDDGAAPLAEKKGT